jgi:tricorn protease-like protein
MTEQRFILIDGVKKGTHSGIWDKQKQNNKRTGDELWIGEVVAMLNEGVAIVEENNQLKKLISKIDFALIRKYDNSLENILDEVYDGEYDKWIQKQVKRSRELQ